MEMLDLAAGFIHGCLWLFLHRAFWLRSGYIGRPVQKKKRPARPRHQNRAQVIARDEAARQREMLVRNRYFIVATMSRINPPITAMIPSRPMPFRIRANLSARLFQSACGFLVSKT